jgi:uncharacterized protein (DUF1330 family)
MAKGYWVARVDVEDEAAYAEYRKLNGLAFAKYKGRFIVRGLAEQVVKGSPRKHNVVIEFDSIEQAKACYASPEYQAAMKFLAKVGQVDLVICAGYEGSQPGD